MGSIKDEYMIGTDSISSARLNLQHYWVQNTCGFLIHPSIPISPGARIADIATGTGIWPISVSSTVPPSVQIDGFDITDKQFPPHDWLPENVTLNTLDILGEIPQHLQGKYDLICVRYFGVMIKNNDPMNTLRNLLSMLKPGGYIQWLEADLYDQKVVASEASASKTVCDAYIDDWHKHLESQQIRYDWLRSFPDICRSVGISNVQVFVPEPVKALRPLAGSLVIGAWEEFTYKILDRDGPSPFFGSAEQLRRRLRAMRRELESGTSFEYKLYVEIAQRPLA